MDLTAVATSLSQIDLQTKIGVALMENMKELTQQQGEALTEMIDSIPAPAGIGEHIDVSL